MTRLEYELLQDDRPELKLPEYWRLWPDARAKVAIMSQEELIASRTARLLARDIGVYDLVKPLPIHETQTQSRQKGPKLA